jgi:hypothetical protein
MIRSAMRTLLRDRVGDENSIYWTDAKLDAALNQAKDVVCNILAEKSPINFGRVSFAIATNGTTTTFPLTGKLDVHKAVELLDGPSSCGGTFVPEQEIDRAKGRFPAGYDENGSWLYYLAYNPANATSPWSLVFLAAPPPGAWTFVYNRKCPDIPTGAGAKDVQTLTRPGGGNIAIAWHGATVVVAWNATAAAIESALLAAVPAPSDGAGSVLVDSQIVVAGNTSPTTFTFENSVRNLADGSANLETIVVTGGSSVKTTPGADGDDSTYSDIPGERGHEAVVAVAAESLLGYDGSATAAFASSWKNILLTLLGGGAAQ